ESFCVRLQVLCHLILTWVRSRLTMERQPWQSVVARWGVHAKRVPSRPPVFPQTRPPLQNDEVDPASDQVVACGESRLAATHHDNAESLDVASRCPFAGR